VVLIEKKVEDLINKHFKDKNLTKEKIKRGLDWSGADLTGFNLENLDLSYINPGDKANFNNTNFQDAILKGVKASGASFINADFYRADLRNAVLFESDFSGANFEFAYLDNVNFYEANLTNANLSNTTVEKTDFSQSIIKKIKLSNVEIDKAHGLEFASGHKDIDESELFSTRLTYLQLEKYFRENGQPDDQAHCYYRRKVIQRKIWKEDKKIRSKFRWLGSLLFDWLCGYGEEPLRIVIWAFIIIWFFGLLYFICDGISGNVVNPFWDSFYFSGLTFTTFGFGDLFPDPSSIVMKIFIIIETFVGIFLIPLFIVSLTRRLMR